MAVKSKENLLSKGWGGNVKTEVFSSSNYTILYCTVLYIRTENLIRLRHKSEEVYTVVCKIISFSTAYSVENRDGLYDSTT